MNKTKQNVCTIQGVNKTIENVYSKFKHMLMKRDEASAKNLTAVLIK